MKAVSEGAWSKEGLLHFKIDGKEFQIAESLIPLPGDHNKINVMAAILVALREGVSQQSIEQSLSTFRGAPHRMELIREIDGVKYINDSKATNVDATLICFKKL